MAAIPKGRFFPLLLGIYTRLSGRGLYPCRSNLDIAAAFFLGVSQISPSSPGVLLPRFSVTLLTANALPLNEWVSKRCRGLTLRHLPSCTAFTIRAWSRRTVW